MTKEQILATTDPPTIGFLRMIDSADPDDANAVKMVHRRYITPQFILESGTAVEIPPSVEQVLTHPTLPPEAKLSLAQQILQDIEQALGLIRKELGQA